MIEVQELNEIWGHFTAEEFMEASMIKLFLMRDKRETSSQIEDHKKRLYNQ